MKHNFMTKMVSALLAVVLSTAAFSVTSFSMIAALVAGVPSPFRSASSGISSLPAFSMAESKVSSV
jgi:hypothetical protein